MKKLLVVLLVFTSSFLKAQNAQDIIDGLKKELKTNPNDKKRATIYSDLTWYYSTVSIDSALQYGNKAVLAAAKLGDSTLIAQVYSDVGAVCFRKGDFQNSKENYLKYYKIRKARNDYRGIAKVNNNLANIYEKNGQYKLAMTSFLDALQYFESIKDEKNGNITRGNIGLILLKLKNYPKALTYIKDVVKYQEENNATAELCVSCVNLGNVYLQMNDTINALKQYNKGLKYCNYVGNKKGVSSAYNNIAAVNTEQKKSKEALALYEKSQKAREELNSDIDQANYDLNLAEEFVLANKLDEAKQLLSNTKTVFEKEKLYDKLQINYKSLIRVYAKLNQLDSVSHYVNKLVIVNNQLLENSVVVQTAELETKYQTAQKEKLILQQQTESKQKNIWLILISSIAIIGFLLFRQQRLKSRQQKEQSRLENELLQEQSNFKIQEQRLEISRELHDSVGSQLTFIISILDNLKNAPVKLENAIEKKIDNLSGYANNSISELRDTIWALNTDNLTISELETRILNFVKEASESVETINFDFKNNCETPFQLTSKQGINLFRVVQEAVNNAVKHSKASQLNIILDKKENQLSLIIQDNGQGFNYEEKKKKSFGLTNLQNRTSELNGTFDLISNENGTAINITIPIV